MMIKVAGSMTRSEPLKDDRVHTHVACSYDGWMSGEKAGRLAVMSGPNPWQRSADAVSGSSEESYDDPPAPACTPQTGHHRHHRPTVEGHTTITHRLTFTVFKCHNPQNRCIQHDPSFEALFPKGNKAWATFTTSPSKRRKLSPSSEPLEEHHTANIETDISSPPQLVTSEGHPAASSPSPPRFLPPHLVAEGARTGRSPTPEPPNTGASSPSAAYAGLTLDSDGSAYGSGQEATTGRRRSSLAQGSLAQVGLKGGAGGQRTSSPAKRRASAMAGGGGPSDDVDMTGTTNGHQVNSTIPSIEVADAGGPPRRNSKGSQHKRDVSADTEAQDVDKAAYQTPQSGASSTGSAGEGPTATDIPSIDDQIAQVMELVKGDSLKEGQKGYVVSNKWLYRVLSRGSNDAGKDKDKYGKDVREGVIGPVDNSGIEMITDPTTNFKDERGDLFIPLKPGIQMTEDFEILPETAWKLIVSWYGQAKGSSVITRYCHNTSTSEVVENLQYELSPPIFTILKLPDRSSGLSQKDLKEKDAVPAKLLASRHENFQSFLKRAKEEANIDLKTKVRVWRILGGLSGSQSGVITPAQSRASSPAPGAIMPVDPGDKLVLDVNTFAGLQRGSEREDIEAKDETANANYNGKSNLDFVGLRQDCVIVLEEQIQGPAGGEWVSDAATYSAKSNGVPVSVTRSGVTSSLKPGTGSRGSSPVPGGGVLTRGRQAKNGRITGTIGLGNLGNTCYMNSALQCVRSVQELSNYFLEGCYKKELNPTNPLGNGGNIAKAYGSLLNELYGGSNNSFSPRNFKNIVGKYGPSFSGYQQQDSQEFLLFLLDGLQEDLNRITKKPYIEKPDSTDEMVNDPIALRGLADTTWDIYKKRNDSVITDLFAGMYKSTLRCPVCDKVSIIFDPFNNLTLQLPIETPWQKRIVYFPLHKSPILVDVDVDKNATFFALKEYVSSKVGDTDPKRMMAGEVYKHKFYRFYEDSKQISEETIAESDQVGVFELEEQPTNWPPPKQAVKKSKFFTYSNNGDDVDIPEMDSPIADTMMVSIFNRRPCTGGTRYSAGKETFGPPGFITLTRAEAKDYDTILKKVLANVANMTTRDFLREEESPASTTGDSDTVLMSAEDADTEPKVHTESLESEDGMIDISMKDQNDKEYSRLTEQPGKRSNTDPLPKMLQPDGEITDAVRKLFEMKVISTTNEMVPMGWSSLSNENQDFPAMALRCTEEQKPQLPKRRSAMETISDTITRDDSISSDEDVDDPPQIVQNPIPDDSDSDGLPTVENLQQGRPSSFRKPLTTYSKKGKQAASKLDQDEPMPDASNEYLIRLGEAIVLDWSADASDDLFLDPRQNKDNGMQGLDTYSVIPPIPDPALAEKKKLRDNRKRNGISLGECLDEFGKPEILSENDAWYCPRCKEHRRASKKFELWKAPDILVIHLKRFSAQGRLRDKIDVRVEFPLQGLDLSSRLAVVDGDKSPIYDLFAVDNHYGGLGGGHYTAFAQNYMDDNWYEYNDSSVSKRSNPQNAVVSSAAYLLFYRRRSTKPLGGPFFEELMAKANQDPSESQPNSRATSPAGEGKRLDATSSRNGSSSALRGVGAAHQAGGGGSGATGTQVAKMRTGVDDDLPAYSEMDPQPVLEGMELDNEDEAVGDLEEQRPLNQIYGAPQWSFQNAQNSPNHENLFEYEEEKDNDSAKVASTAGSDREDRMLDFADDPGTTHGDFGTPPQEARESDVPLVDEEILDEPSVAEIHHDADAEADELA